MEEENEENGFVVDRGRNGLDEHATVRRMCRKPHSTGGRDRQLLCSVRLCGRRFWGHHPMVLTRVQGFQRLSVGLRRFVVLGCFEKP